MGSHMSIPSRVEVTLYNYMEGTLYFPVEGKWQPTPVFLPGQFHGQRRSHERHNKGY